MFKGIKILFNFIFRPTKLASSTIFNKRKKTNVLLKPLKYGLIFIGVIVGFLVFVILASEGIQYVDGNRYVKSYIKNTDGSAMRPNNPNGTINGLNLLLIDNIKTEGYVKEYLSLARDNYDGKLNAFSNKITVDGVISTSVNETGVYPGTPLPISYLPFEGDGPVWNKSYGGYPAEVMKLSMINRKVINQPSIGGVGSLVTNSGADVVGAPGSDYSVTPFQINLYGSTSSFPSGWKSSMNGYNDSGRSSADVLYFPDQLTYLNARYDDISSFIDLSTVNNDDIKLLMYSLLYNPGSGNAQGDEFNGHPWASDNTMNTLNIIYKDLEYVFNKYGDKLGSMDNFNTRSYHSYVYMPLVKELGWKFQSGNVDYVLTDGLAAWESYGYGGSLNDFVNSNTESFSMTRGDYYRTTQPLTVIKDGVTIRTDGIAIAHAFTKTFIGKVIYAKMLKYAGVDVDPTNPNTYMNTLPEGEWKPSGNSAWMGDYGLNPSEIGPQRTSMLNEAVKWLGSWYSNHNPVTPPVKDASGEWIRDEQSNGFDCSSFVQYSYQTVLGIDISRTTWSQRANSNTYVIDKSEAKAGDLIYYYDGIGGLDWGHVSIYINDNTMLHSPIPGRRIEFSHWDGTPDYQIKEYRRVKGVN